MTSHPDQGAPAPRQAGPLTGIRVLDFTRVLAGPFCTVLLADIGAEVIKVESLHGDDYRHIGPFKEGESALFLLNNRNKKSLTLDLKSNEGKRIAVDLAGKCDVVVENFKPGVAKRLGIDYEALSTVNPGLVYASISGFGQTGPMADRPAFDLIAQAMSGIMDVTGQADGPPTKVGESFGDLTAGLYASWAVMAGLFEKERSGRGTYIDIGMFDALFSLLPTAIAQWMVTGKTTSRVGNRHPLTTPFGSFQAKDGQVVITVLNNAQFRNLMVAIDREELADDPAFATDELRTQSEPRLRAIIEEGLSGFAVDEVVTRLSEANVPASPILSMGDAIESAQVAARGLLVNHQHPKLGPLPIMEQPVHFSGMTRGKQNAAPALGQHSAFILNEILGLDPDAIAELMRKGVVTGSDGK
ncbi:MAG: CoA transferase [Rhodospirillales bacterium]|nr:CoA transferase [Rhodospirillales bacterium]